MKNKSAISRASAMLVEIKLLIGHLDDLLKGFKPTLQTALLLIMLVSSTVQHIYTTWTEPVAAVAPAVTIHKLREKA